jgi:hypothetical protein
MGFAIPLKGHLYYKKPDKIHLTFTTIPSVLKNKKSLFQDVIPRSLKSEDYSGKVIKIEKLDNKLPCYFLELIPLKDEKIEKINLWISTENYLVYKSKIFYENKSTITSMQSFKKVECFTLPERQFIDFNLPTFRSETYVEYKDYSVNIPSNEIPSN